MKNSLKSFIFPNYFTEAGASLSKSTILQPTVGLYMDEGPSYRSPKMFAIVLLPAF
jgi:hypothetical protein